MDTSTITDISGYGASVTRTGSEQKAVPVAYGASYSQKLDSTHTLTITNAPIYRAGQELNSFSIVASVYPIKKTGTVANQQIIGNNGKTDGLYINGTTIYFATGYVGQGTAVCSYNVLEYKKLDIVAIHTPKKNSLYINGVAVDEVDITAAQTAAAFDVPDNNLYMGATTGAQAFAVNNLALYPRVLAPEDIAALYAYNNQRPTSSIPKMFGGTEIDLTDRHPFLNASWLVEDDWNAASKTNVSVVDDVLNAETDTNDLTIAGVWADSVDLYNGLQPITIDSVVLYWNGVGELVEASIDGSTWVTATKGVPLSNIPVGFDPTGHALFIRVTFTAGLDEAFIDELYAKGFNTNTAIIKNRTITYTSPLAVFGPLAPALLKDDNGVRITNPGSITIGPDTISSSPQDVYTVEVWAKSTSSTSPTLSSNLTTGTTVYTNGVSGLTWAENEWRLLHFVSSTPFTGNFVFTGNVQLSHFAIYPVQLTQAQTLLVLGNYLGRNKVSYDGSGVIPLQESATAANVYAHDWDPQAAQ